MMADTSPLHPHETTPATLAHVQAAQAGGEPGALPRKAPEHGRAQEAQQEYEKYYHDLVAGSVQGIGILHRDGIIQAINPVLATCFGYVSQDDLCGRALGTLLAPHERAAWEEYLHACVQHPGTVQRHIIQGIRQDQSACWLDLCLSATTWQGLPAILVTCLDITARHNLEIQLLQSHKMSALGALAGGIAHDFNNMLAAILGYTELVMDDMPRESLVWHRLQRVRTAGERAKDLVRQILMATAAAAVEPVPEGTERVLFIEDEESIARLGCMMLERLGYTVTVSTSAHEALALLRAAPERFDLVITDHTMPAMTGAALVEEFRRLRADLPVIMCSGFSHTMHADRAQALGVDAFLSKPFLHRDLGLTVRRVLDQRRAQSR
jgi:PAS domain S-box-containing protein